MVTTFLDLHTDEFVSTLEEYSSDEVVPLLDRLTPAAAALVLERLTPDVAALVIDGMTADVSQRILPLVDPGRLAAVLARLDSSTQDDQIAMLPPDLGQELRALMAFPADSAGHLMDTRVSTFREDASAGQVRSRLRPLRDRGVREVAVLGADGRLVGQVLLVDVALADPDTRVSQLVHRGAVRIHAMASRDDVVERLTELNLTSLPVVDSEDRVLGVIAHDTLLRAAEEEVTADLQTMVGVSKDERALSPITFAVRKRLPWLQVNLLTAFFAASVVGLFEDTIARFTALAVLLPVVAGQSGNTGAQALAVTMRGLALREIRLRHWRWMSFKEGMVGLVNGIGVSATTAVAVYLWSQSMGLAIVIGTSMVISMLAAGVAGALVPMLLVAARQDPAQASSIILTTVTDIVGFFSFLGIATVLAGML